MEINKSPKKVLTKKVSQLINKQIELHGRKVDTTELEKKIDILVFIIGGHTYDEIIESNPKFSLSREEYEDFEVEG